jgi:hypothetical protein
MLNRASLKATHTIRRGYDRLAKQIAEAKPTELQ